MFIRKAFFCVFVLICLLVLTTLGNNPTSQEGKNIKIPNTTFSVVIPKNWSQVPGNQGAVLGILAPDGTAQIMVNVLDPGDIAPEQFFSLVHDGIVANIATDTINAWQSFEDKQETINSIEFRFRNFRSTRGEAIGLEMGFIFARSKKQIIIFNAVIAPQGKNAHGQQMHEILRSLRDSSIAPELTKQPETPKIVPENTEKTVQKIELPEMLAMEKEICQLLEKIPYNQELMDGLALTRSSIATEFWRSDKIDEAVSYMKSVVEIAPNNPEYLELFGDILDDFPDATAPYLAQSYYEDALKLDAKLRNCRSKLASSYLATGDFDDAIFHFQILADNDGNIPDSSFFREMTLCYISTDREEDGIAFMKKLADRGDVNFMIATAILQNQLGRGAEALAGLKKVEKTATDPELKKYAAGLAREFAANK